MKKISFGQNEPLYVRLANILKDYPTTTLIKEILQNADDAKATEVKFYLDTTIYDRNSLFSDGMDVLQGPSLLSFNNSIFKETDYKSLSKLGDSEKKDNEETTGRFGIGFNSIYHITDTPCIVSGDYFTFLDPLLKFSDDTSNPGAQYKISENIETILKCSDQIKPFEKVGVNFNEKIEGTFFRYPLRQKESKISKNCVSSEEILTLFDDFIDKGIDQILFLQNVKKLSFFTISGENIKCYSKFEIQVTKTLSNGFFFSTLENTFEKKNEVLNWIKLSKKKDKPEMFEEDAFPYSLCADIVCRLDGKTKGFCYTTLPVVETGFPIHFNGWFELMSNRKSIWKEESKKDLKWSWNMELMKIISELYKDLIIHLGNSPPSENFNIYELFPTFKLTNAEWKSILIDLFNSLKSQEVIPCVQNENKKCTIGNGWLYSFDNENSIKLLPFLDKLDISVFQMPKHVRDGFSEVSQEINQLNSIQKLENILSMKKINSLAILDETLTESFLEIIYALSHSSEFRSVKKILETYLTVFRDTQNFKYDTIVKFILKLGMTKKDVSTFKNMIRVPSGSLDDNFIGYKPIDQLLDKENEDFKLLYQMDQVFCLEEFDQYKNCMINDFGMVSSITPSLFEKKIDSSKPEDLMIVLNRNALNIQSNLREWKLMIESVNVKFIPVLKEHNDYPLKLYKSDDYEAVGSVYQEVKLVGSVAPVVGCMCENIVKKLLKLDTVPPIQKMIEQLEILSNENIVNQEWIEKIYESIENSINSKTTFKNDQKSKIFLMNTQFINSNIVFLKVNENWSPILYQLPFMYSKYLKLVKQFFKIGDLKSTDLLLQMTQLPEQNLEEEKKISIMYSMIEYCVDQFPELDLTEIHLPTSYNEFKNTSELLFIDNKDHYDNLKTQIDIGKYSILHSKFGQFVKKFNIQTFSNLISKEHSETMEFCGQKEPLKRRVRNIIEENYSFGIPIIHEMIQNADDAEATTLKIVLDKREHSGNMLLHPDLKETQGASLFFINDKQFTDQDLRNLTELGKKGKLDRIGVTGQFNLGFNSTYHLTDSPMILSNKKLTVLDPLEKYGNKPGRIFLISEFVKKNCKDSLLPFEMIGEDENFDGTFIRLPLRTQKSEISNVHNSEDVITIMMNFQKNMEDSMLFLKNLITISMEIIEKNGERTTVAICKKKADMQIQEAVKTLYSVEKCIKEDKEFKSSKFNGYVILEKSTKDKTESTKYLVNYYIKSKESVSSILQESKNHIGRFIPFASTAIQLIDNKIKKIDGFAFHTLPIDKSEQKFHFHVNSSFTVEKSRKSLSVAGYYKNDSFGNKWNRIIFSEIITFSILQILKFLIAKNPGKSIENYHEIFPTDDKFGKDFFEKAKDEKIFFSLTREYIKMDEVLYLPNFSSLTKSFIEDGIKICKLPCKIKELISAKEMDTKYLVKYYQKKFEEFNLTKPTLLENIDIAIYKDATTIKLFWNSIKSHEDLSAKKFPFLLKSGEKITMFNDHLFVNSDVKDLLEQIPTVENYLVDDIYNNIEILKFSFEKIINEIEHFSKLNKNDEKWHQKIWKLLIPQFSVEKVDFHQMFNNFLEKDIQLIVLVKDKMKLIPISEHNKIVFCSDEKLIDFLKPLELPRFEHRFFNEKLDPYYDYCCQNPNSIQNKNEVLQYFYNANCNISKLKKLEFFETPSGKRISLNDWRTYIESDRSIDLKTSKYEFLRPSYQLQDIYKKLKLIEKRNDLEIVSENICELDPESLFQWIDYFAKDFHRFDKKILNILSGKNFIDGQTASYFYKRTPIFEKFLPQTKFLPSSFDEKRYASFFKSLGMKTSDPKDLIEILKEKDGKINSTNLCLNVWKYFLTSSSNSEILVQLTKLNYTPTMKLDSKLYPSQKVKDIFQMNEMVDIKYKDICWTHSLFVYDDASIFDCKNQFDTFVQFGKFNGKPKVKDVVQHLLLIPKLKFTEEKYENIVDQIYSYLNENLSEFSKEFKTSMDHPFIYHKGEFFTHEEFVFDAPDFKNFSVKKLPQQYQNKYEGLFKAFGVKLSITLEQAQLLLNKIFKNHYKSIEDPETIDQVLFLINKIISISKKAPNCYLTIDLRLVKDDIFKNDCSMDVVNQLDLSLINILHRGIKSEKLDIPPLSKNIETRRQQNDLKNEKLIDSEITHKISNRLKNDSFQLCLNELIKANLMQKYSLKIDLKIQKLSMVSIKLVSNLIVQYYFRDELISKSDENHSKNAVSIYIVNENMIQMLNSNSEYEVYRNVSKEIRNFFQEDGILDSGDIMDLLYCHDDKIIANREHLGDIKLLKIGKVIHKDEIKFFKIPEYDHVFNIGDRVVCKLDDERYCYGKIQDFSGSEFYLDFGNSKKKMMKEEMLISIYDTKAFDTEDMNKIDLNKLQSFFICPISQDIFECPVVASDGHTYEKEMLDEYFKNGFAKSPLDNKTELEIGKYYQNYDVASFIKEYFK
eukprot:gene4758-8340_t